MNSKDRQPAFPYPQIHHSGMELRDWYAGKIIAGLLAEPITQGENPTTYVVMGRYKNERETPESYIASAAFKIADAMMEARKK